MSEQHEIGRRAFLGCFIATLAASALKAGGVDALPTGFPKPDETGILLGWSRYDFALNGQPHYFWYVAPGAGRPVEVKSEENKITIVFNSGHAISYQT